jgi:multidrug efflux pump
MLAACFGMIWYFQGQIKSELAPLEDRSMIRTNLTAPEGTDFDRMESIMYDLASTIMDSVPEQRMVFGITAPGFGAASTNSGFVSLLLKDPRERERSQMTFITNWSKLPAKSQLHACSPTRSKPSRSVLVRACRCSLCYKT